MGREDLAPTIGRKSVAGYMNLPVDLRAIGLWFTELLGSSVTSEQSGVFTHIFSSCKDSLPSFSIEKTFKEVKDYSLFNGCKVGSMDFDFQADGNSSVSVSLIGNVEVASSILASSTT